MNSDSAMPRPIAITVAKKPENLGPQMNTDKHG
jgi:hypothetical protein